MNVRLMAPSGGAHLSDAHIAHVACNLDKEIHSLFNQVLMTCDRHEITAPEIIGLHPLQDEHGAIVNDAARRLEASVSARDNGHCRLA